MSGRRRAAEQLEPATPKPKPSHWRYLRAYVECLDDGGEVNQKAIATKLGISRQAIWKMHMRHPWLAKWTSDHIETHTAELVGPVIRKMGLIGLRGSKDHAELFLKTRGRLQQADDDGPRHGPAVLNIAIPRPDGGAPILLQHKVG